MKRRSVVIALLFACGTFGSVPAQTQQDTNGMVPFTMDDRGGTSAPSPADVSFLLDAPAGKHGFLQVKDGHLATGEGLRIRLWGVNITDWSPGSRQIPKKEDAALWAATLARFGVNCVRFQFLDLKEPRGLIDNKHADTRALDPQQLDREDFFISELEKRGIYIDFNLLVGRPFNAADGVQDAAGLREGAKGTSLFDARMIQLQKEYARELLTHRNPYTNRTYTEDPAVALIEINNENALDIGYHAPSPFYLAELTGMYNEWLSRHRTPEQIEKIRQIASAVTTVDTDPATAPAARGSTVPLLASRGAAATAAPMRFYAEAEFFDDMQRTYFADMEKYLKDTLGSRSLVIATADHSHANSGYPMLLATSGMDVIDGHDYWQHPEMYVRKSPMVNDPLHSTVVDLSRSAIAGKPYTVSEVNSAFPNDYGGEGIPILAAYGLLQDWDGIMWYTFEPKADPAAWKPYVGDPFDISLDPVKMPELAQGALMFLRGDVSKAGTVVDRSYSRRQVFDSMLLPAATERPYFTPGFPLALPLEDEVRIASLDGAPTRLPPGHSVPDPIVSDTRQLAWYTTPADTGLVTIDTPRTEGLIGFVKANGRAVSHLSAQLSNSFCTVLLSSMDEKPIAQSSRMLLVAGARVENTGQTWNSAGTDLTQWGGSPTLIEQVSGTVTLQGLDHPAAVLLQPLDGSGQPKGEAIRATHDGDAWRLPLGQTVTTWYEVRVTR